MHYIMILSDHLKRKKSATMCSIALCIVAASFLSGCWKSENYNFIDWGSISPEFDVQSIALKDLIIDDHVHYVVQLSPYTFKLSESHMKFENAMRSSRALPVSEGKFHFAYFDSSLKFLGYDEIPTNGKEISAKKSFSEDYVVFDVERAVALFEYNAARMVVVSIHEEEDS